MSLILRPYTASDLPRPAASQSEFDDFGPVPTMTSPPPSELGDDGYLAVEVDGTVVGDVGWHWTGSWTDMGNVAEQRSLERAGFVREGMLRGALCRLGAFHDLGYSVLRTEWQVW